MAKKNILLLYEKKKKMYKFYFYFLKFKKKFLQILKTIYLKKIVYI